MAMWEWYRKWLEIGESEFGDWQKQKEYFDKKNTWVTYHHSCRHLNELRRELGDAILFFPLTKTQLKQLSHETGIPAVLKWWEDLEQKPIWVLLNSHFTAVFDAFLNYNWEDFSEAAEALRARQRKRPREEDE